jgi:hypothetical protein
MVREEELADTVVDAAVVVDTDTATTPRACLGGGEQDTLP